MARYKSLEQVLTDSKEYAARQGWTLDRNELAYIENSPDYFQVEDADEYADRVSETVEQAIIGF